MNWGPKNPPSLEPHPTRRKLRVSLANGTTILEEEKVVEIPFQLEGHSTRQKNSKS